MSFPGKKRLRQTLRWLRSRTGQGALILGYHRISVAKADPYAICVHPQHFAAHMALLRRHAHPLSLSALVNRLQDDTLPSRAVAVTFDDGYADVLYTARPVLAQYEIPATVFVTTGNPGRPFWWDELSETILLPPQLPAQLSLVINGEPLHWQPSVKEKANGESVPRQRLTLLLKLHDRLVALPDERSTVLSQLKEWSGAANETADANARAMTFGELRALAEDSWIEIGAHTVNHPALDTLSEDAQRFEIQHNKEQLESCLQRNVSSFSYPHGRGITATRSLLPEMGFHQACSSVPDVTRRASDPLALPRFWMGDWPERDFETWLRRWLV